MNRVDLLEQRESERDYGKFWRTVAIAIAVILVIVSLGMVAINADTGRKLDNANAEIASLQQQTTELQNRAASESDRADAALGQTSVLEGENQQLTTQVDNLQGRIRGLEADVKHWKQKATQQANAGGYNVNAVANFGDGTWRVGEEIQPGTYRADGGGSCYWERLSGFSGNLGDILANDFGTKNPTVTIPSSDVGFSTEDCGTWHKIG